jgi:hypothetical protein
MTHEKIEAHSRTQIAKFLPNALSVVLKNHQEFLKEKMPTEVADYKKHQEACKVALAHIQLLTKLAAWADIIDPSVEQARKQTELNEDVVRARREIEAYDAAQKTINDEE